MTHKKNAVVGLTAAVATLTFAGLSGPSSASATPVSLTDKADVYSAAAACVGQAAVVMNTSHVLIDGNEVPFADTFQYIQGGSTVTINFTVAAGCDPTKFGLAAYSSPVHNANPTYEEVLQQTYLNSVTTTVAGGQSGTLTITLPQIADCQYQVDFFTGDVLQTFTLGNFYGSPVGRLITAKHIAVPNCAEVLETTTTRAPETTTTTAAPTTTTVAPTTTTNATVAPNEARPSTTVPAEVLGETIDNTTTTQAAEVLAESLANTGANSLGLAGAAGALALAGGSLRVMAATLRRRRTAQRGR